MDTRTALLLAAMLGLAGCNLATHGAVKGSGKVIDEDRKVANFKSVRLEGAAAVIIKVGPATKVTLTTDDNIAPLVTTSVDKDILVIDPKEAISPTKFVVTIETPSLEGFEIDGAGDATITGLTGTSFRATIVGAGSIKLKGAVQNAHLEIDGAGDIDADELVAEAVRASIDGAGGIKVNAAKTLDAEMNGAGEIRFRGNPVVTKKMSGVGSVGETWPKGYGY